ncbi:hypothetical protein FACS189459_2300 [Bacilli bacterium]|nr:hypothetical protein FACS189459_2300 [Bacilli bacterium]
MTDNRGVFTVLRDKNKNPEEYKNEKLTQFGFICESVGIELKTTSIAQRKGSIERANRTVQDRLTAEFKLHNVKTIEEANAILPRLLDELNK